jgi:hypothetical protein
MNYILIFKVDGKNYLVLSDDNQILGYTSKEEVMNAFSGYNEKWKQSYESAMSACIGMLHISPKAVEAPENANDLKQYLLSDTITSIRGGNISSFKGVLISEDILKKDISNLNHFDIWSESMVVGGIK